MKKSLNTAITTFKKQEPKLSSGDKKAKQKAEQMIQHIINTNGWKVKNTIICPSCFNNNTEEKNNDTSYCHECQNTWQWNDLTEQHLQQATPKQLINLFTEMLTEYGKKYL